MAGIEACLRAARLWVTGPALLVAGLAAAALPAGSATAPNIVTVRPPEAGSPPDAASKAIEQALASARALKAANPGQTVTVTFAAGTYRLARPVVLKAEDSGSQRAPLRLVADGVVRITGAQLLGLTQIKPGDPTPPLDPSATGHVFAAALDPGRVPFFEPRGNASPDHPESVLLLQNGVPLTVARWPKSGYAEAVPKSDKAGPRVTPVFQAPAVKSVQWAHEPYLWAGGYWTYNWAFETEPVRDVDQYYYTVRLAQLATEFAQADSLRYFMFNAFSEITAPGDYAVTPVGKLVVWPFPNVPVESAELQGVLTVTNAHDILISGFLFDGALGDAVTFDNSSRIVMADGMVRDSGGDGIVVSGGDHDRIEHMVIADTGENGVSLTGGDRRTLQPGGHVVNESIIVRFARLTRTYRGAVLLQGVGNAVTRCYLGQGPHLAVQFSGNDHVIAGNEITDVVLETGDSGVIYGGRDVFSRGTLIAGNYIHDVGGNSGLDVRGIYFDDFLGGNSVRGNLFVGVRLPVFINSGSGNQITGNIFIQPVGAAVTVRDSADTWDGFQGDLYRNARPALEAQPLYREHYGDAAMVFRQPHPVHNRIGGNLQFGGSDFGTEHGASAAAQDITPSIRRGPRLLHTRTLADIAFAVRSNDGSAFPFGFERADRKVALRDLRYAGKVLP